MNKKRCTPAQLRVLDNLATKRPIDAGFNRLNGFNRTIESLREKGMLEGNCITELGLKMIKAV